MAQFAIHVFPVTDDGHMIERGGIYFTERERLETFVDNAHHFYYDHPCHPILQMSEVIGGVLERDTR